MVAYTRAEAKVAFNHVLDNVLGRNDTSHLKLFLAEEGIIDIFDFVTLSEKIIEALVCKDTGNKGNFLPIKKGDKMLVKCFLAYDQLLEDKGIEIDYIKSRRLILIIFELAQRIGF
jgi:hypothetical protein